MGMPDRSPPRQLFDLPNEVLALVLEHLNQGLTWNGEAVSSFRQTCKLALKVADPEWCRCVRLTQLPSSEEVDAFLATHPQWHSQVRDLEIEPEQAWRKSEDAVTMLQVVSQLPKLQCLSIKTSSSRECLDVLDQQLQMTAFGELRKCHLQPALLRDDHVHLQLDHLLRASKLTSLRLCGISLAGFEKSSVTSHSTVLKDLTMTTCAVDRHSLSAFLSKPRALKSVHFGGLGPVGESTKHLNPRDELRTTELMHEILGREQPNIQKLRVSLRNGGVISFKQHRDGLIFKQLTNLKSLSFGTIGGALLWPTNDYDNGLWCPTNAFNGLPPAIECIKFRPPCGKIDLEGMALALNLDGLALTPNGWRYPRKDVPASLQQLEIFAEKRREWGTPRRELLPQRPFTEADQTTEDSLMNGIDRLMTGLTLKQLTCIERHEVWDLEGEKVDEEGEEKENSHSVCVIHYSFRKITATRNNAIAKSDQVSSCSSPYSVGEVTWEEFQTMYDYEYWQTLESEAY